MPELFSPHFIWWSSASSPPLSIIRHGRSPSTTATFSLTLSLSLSLPFCFSLSLPLPYLLRCTASWGKCPLLFCIPHSAKQTEEIHSLCLYLHNEWSRCHSSTLAAYWVLQAASLAAWSRRRCQAFQRLARTMKDKSKERSTSMWRATLAVSAFLPLVLEAAAPRPPTLPFSDTWLSNPHPLTLPILL